MGLMNKLDKQYTDLLQDILDNGTTKGDRTGTGTISVFGRQIRHKMSEGFPLLTTKKMPFKTIVTELLWFLRGDTNIKYLVDNGCNIWNGDAFINYNKYVWKLSNLELLTQEEFINKIKTNDTFAKEWGELGPIYGKQWRQWNTHKTVVVGHNGNHNEFGTVVIDQIQNLINDLKTNPDSRRLMVTAWNPADLEAAVLPPCHYGFQVYTRELSLDERFKIAYKNLELRKKLEAESAMLHYPSGHNKVMDDANIPTRAISLMWNQRSCDFFLGIPFNVASYGLLLEIIAKEVNMIPDELIGNLGDVHLYSNHIEQAKEQIGRELTHEEKIEYARSLYGNEVWWDINDKRVITVLQRKRQTREPYPLPTLNINTEFWKTQSGKCGVGLLDTNLEGFEISDFQIENYQSHPTIKAPLSN
jgi:thymidylate synthase